MTWVMRQSWHSLLFAHWPAEPDRVQRLLPAGLALDTFNGQAWISVVPFYMTGVRVRAMPPVPTAHAFAELNVRTYVTHDGQPGVWFFSLDAASTLAVLAARVGAALPYFRATMRVDLGSKHVAYHSERWPGLGRPARFDATYWPESFTQSAPNPLDTFLTDRFALFSGHSGRMWRVDIEHPRWHLYPARANIRANTMITAAGVTTLTDDPLLHFATGQDVRFGPLVRVV